MSTLRAWRRCALVRRGALAAALGLAVAASAAAQSNDEVQAGVQFDFSTPGAMRKASISSRAARSRLTRSSPMSEYSTRSQSSAIRTESVARKATPRPSLVGAAAEAGAQGAGALLRAWQSGDA